ncbi:MAG: FAD-binding oxidoreductase, partial [Tagaea sp.]|nr:FAD-binding oxidoreductase [Tagaea sp.]
MSLRWKTGAFAGWGRTAPTSARAARPERQAELDAAFAEAKALGQMLARGNARSYGDAAQNADGALVLGTRLDRFVSFDPETKLVVAEPGVTFGDVLAAFLPRGLAAPVSPGTMHATLGGALAADVHGKNHDRAGSFGDHVEWFDLLVASGETLRCSREANADLFAATIGGMGLTGIVRRLALKLTPASPFVRVKETRIDDLDEFFAEFAAARDTAAFTVGWIDALAQGAKLGRGVFETAAYAPDAALRPPGLRAPKPVPIDFPGFALSGLVVRAFNELYWRRIPETGREGERALDRFLYPLDALADWNRIYGKRGFHQFQAVVPDADARNAVRKLLETVAAGGNASFLAVLKTLGGEGQGHLSFPMRGVTLALDIPNAPGALDLLADLERIARDAGGRIYLAKDS